MDIARRVFGVSRSYWQVNTNEKVYRSPATSLHSPSPFRRFGAFDQIMYCTHTTTAANLLRSITHVLVKFNASI